MGVVALSGVSPFQYDADEVFRKSAVTERWVLNAFPLIVLARAGHAGLFLELADQVVVPRPAALEIEAGPEVAPVSL